MAVQFREIGKTSLKRDATQKKEAPSYPKPKANISTLQSATENQPAGVTFYAPTRQDDKFASPIFSLRWNKGSQNIKDVQMITHSNEAYDYLPAAYFSPSKKIRNSAISDFASSLTPQDSPIWRRIMDSDGLRQKIENETGLPGKKTYTTMSSLERLSLYSSLINFKHPVPGTNFTIGPFDPTGGNPRRTPYRNANQVKNIPESKDSFQTISDHNLKISAEHIYNDISKTPSSIPVPERSAIKAIALLTPNQPNPHIVTFGATNKSMQPVVGAIATSPKGATIIQKMSVFSDALNSSSLIRSSSNQGIIGPSKGAGFKEAMLRIHTGHSERAGHSTSNSRQNNTQKMEITPPPTQGGHFDLSALLSTLKNEQSSGHEASDLKHTMEKDADSTAPALQLHNQVSKEEAIDYLSERAALLATNTSPKLAALDLSLNTFLKEHGLQATVSPIKTRDGSHNTNITLMPTKEINAPDGWNGSDIERMLSRTSELITETQGDHAGARIFTELAGRFTANLYQLGYDALNSQESRNILNAGGELAHRDSQNISSDHKSDNQRSAVSSRVQDMAESGQTAFHAAVNLLAQDNPDELESERIGEAMDEMKKAKSSFTMGGESWQEKEDRERMERAMKHEASRPRLAPSGPSPSPRF